MSSWVKNLIGVSIVAILLAMAWRLLLGDGGEAHIGNFSVNVNAKAEAARERPVAPHDPTECRLPEHGIEAWGKVQKWTADSGWRKGGSSPGEFCRAQQAERQAQYPERKVDLISTGEDHKSEFTPFKHDYYRYTCLFEDHWEPLYKLAASEKCPKP